MLDPKINKEYVFVRLRDGVIEQARFGRSSDGGALVMREGFASVHEHAPDAWRNGLAELADAGYMECEEAKRAGLIPSDWIPPPEEYVDAIARPI